jgi:hypothetical protein
MSIRCRSGEDEEDFVCSNYEENKLYIHEGGIGNKGGGIRGTGNRNSVSHRVIGNWNRNRVIGKIRPGSTHPIFELL